MSNTQPEQCSFDDLNSRSGKANRHNLENQILPWI